MKQQQLKFLLLVLAMSLTSCTGIYSEPIGYVHHDGRYHHRIYGYKCYAHNGHQRFIRTDRRSHHIACQRALAACNRYNTAHHSYPHAWQLRPEFHNVRCHLGPTRWR